jgi:hypothetical protein
MDAGSRQYDAVGEWQFELGPDLCGIEGDARSQIDDQSLVHQSNGLQCSILVALLEDPFKNFQNANGWNNEVLDILDGRGVEIGIGSVCKIFEPSTRLDEVQILSLSRSTVVSMPFKKPRIRLMFFIGISSIRFSYKRIWTFEPGLISMDCLTSRGMTT